MVWQAQMKPSLEKRAASSALESVLLSMYLWILLRWMKRREDIKSIGVLSTSWIFFFAISAQPFPVEIIVRPVSDVQNYFSESCGISVSSGGSSAIPKKVDPGGLFCSGWILQLPLTPILGPFTTAIGSSFR